MHRFNERARMLGIDLGMDAMSQIEDMTIAVTETGKYLANLLLDYCW